MPWDTHVSALMRTQNVEVCMCLWMCVFLYECVCAFIENLVLLLALWSIIYEQPSIEDTSLCLIQKHII